MQGAKQLPAAGVRQKKPDLRKRLGDLRENCPYLIMILPAIVVVFLFNYLPIYGVLIAFQDFMPGDPISPARPSGWALRTSTVSSQTRNSGR